jgi:hypothetical protein
MEHTEDKLVRRLLEHRTAVEALWWLRQTDGVIRTLGAFGSPEASLAFVNTLYEAGALQVVATKINPDPPDTPGSASPSENTSHIVIKLPDDTTRRRAVFRLQGDVARRLGFEQTRDSGQAYLYCALD